LFQDKAGVPARDINAMAGERATECKANIRDLGYRSVEFVRHPAFGMASTTLGMMSSGSTAPIARLCPCPFC
jgi:hypothetical protein